MRERGLKLINVSASCGVYMSLPMRERGLKHVGYKLPYFYATSLPMRERGLKHVGDGSYNAKIIVAPHAGAWIETQQSKENTK